MPKAWHTCGVVERNYLGRQEDKPREDTATLSLVCVIATHPVRERTFQAKRPAGTKAEWCDWEHGIGGA